MKRFTAFLMAVILCLSATACKKSSSESETSLNSADGVITVDTSLFEAAQTAGTYYCKQAAARLTGKLSDDDGIETIRLELLNHRGDKLFAVKTTASEQWAFADFGLLIGYNKLRISALDDDNAVCSSVELDVFNTVQSNEDALHLYDRDSDKDGLSDGFEIYYSFTNVFNADSDKNGVSDALEDFDGDGLNNTDEQIHSGSPRNADTDGDKLPDADEVTFGTALNDSDTNDDGVSDFIEFAYGLNSADNNANVAINYQTKEAFSSECSVTVDINIAASLAESVAIRQLPSTSLLMRSLASDVVVTGISLTADGTFNRATVSIDTTVDHEDGLALYYFDPENVVLTRVPNQQYNNNRITATLSHFSDYIVLKEPQDDYVGMAASMREHLDNLDTDDADGDGFINSEDPSPYSAKTFKEYEDYLRYMYPGQDVVTVYVNQPGDYGEDKIIDGTRTGHSWISYTKSDGTTKSAGVYASEDDVLFNKKVPSQVRTSDNWYTSDDPDNKKSYTPNSTIQPESEYASVMIPFVVDPSYYDEFIDFINNYRKPYQLYDNNCTTFVMECLDVLDIPHYFNEYNEDTQDDGWLNSHLFKHMKDSNSPGHAAYNATEYYETRTVRPLQEKDGVVSYASPASYSTATMTDTEKVDDQVYFTSSDKVRWNGHTYQIIEVSMSWNAAKAYCEKQGGHLMTITSETEQEIASSLMQMGNKRQYWIGLDTQSGWVTGEAVTYTNWDAREPNSCVRRNQRERYTHILNVANPAVNGSARLKWNDMFNDNTFPGEESNFSLCTVGVLCEWDYEC